MANYKLWNALKEAKNYLNKKEGENEYEIYSCRFRDE